MDAAESGRDGGGMMATTMETVDERVRKVIGQLDHITNWMHARGVLLTSAFVRVESSGSITEAHLTFDAPERHVEGAC